MNSEENEVKLPIFEGNKKQLTKALFHNDRNQWQTYFLRHFNSKAKLTHNVSTGNMLVFFNLAHAHGLF